VPPRFYCPSFSDREATLDGDELHHLRSVRRLGPGDDVEVFDGAGRLAHCRLARVAKHEAVLDVLAVVQVPPPAVELTIATAIPKAARMDWLVEKITELGATGLWPLVTERSDVTARGDAKRDKWRRHALEAAKQCGRAWLPAIADPAPLADAVAQLASARFDAILLADPSPEAARLADAVPPGASRLIGFVGPEGGFTPAEVAALRAAGARPVRLAEHILRIETAALALAAAVCASR
jgi:16S rRNA (uracil1498-N3)-methyltransferase